eukprot:gene29930-37351_t
MLPLTQFTDFIPNIFESQDASSLTKLKKGIRALEECKQRFPELWTELQEILLMRDRVAYEMIVLEDFRDRFSLLWSLSHLERYEELGSDLQALERKHMKLRIQNDPAFAELKQSMKLKPTLSGNNLTAEEHLDQVVDELMASESPAQSPVAPATLPFAGKEKGVSSPVPSGMKFPETPRDEGPESAQ